MLFAQLNPDVFSVFEANNVGLESIISGSQQEIDALKDGVPLGGIRRASSSGGGPPSSEGTLSALPQPSGPTRAYVMQAISLSGETPYPQYNSFSLNILSLSLVIPSLSLIIPVALVADGSKCDLGPWMGLTVLGPSSISAERRGVMQQPGLSSGRLQQLPLPLTPEYWEERARRALHGQQAGQKQQQHKRQQHSESQSQEGGTNSFPTLAESANKGQHQRGPPSGKQQKNVAETVSLKKPGKTHASSTPDGPIGDVSSSSKDETDLRQALLRTWPGALNHVPLLCLISLPIDEDHHSISIKAASNAGELPHALQTSSTRGAIAAQQAASMALGVARRQTLAAGRPAATSKRESELAVYLQVEYETLDGRRFFPTHQQLGYKEPQPGSGGKSSSQVCSM